MLKTKKFWIILITVILIITAIFIRSQKNGVPEFSSAAAEQTTLVQSVSETGSVSGELDIAYGWEISGRVARIFKNAGTQVRQGDLIAELYNAGQSSSVAQATAQLNSAKASLNLKIAGVSEEEKAKTAAIVDQKQASLEKQKVASASAIDVAEKEYEDTQNNLELAEGGENSTIVNDAYEDLVNTAKSTLTTISDALTKSDNIIGVDNTTTNDDYDDGLGSNNMSTLNKAETTYRSAKSVYVSAQTTANGVSFSSAHSQIDAAANSIQKAVTAVQNHLFDMQTMLAASRAVLNTSESELTTMKTDINAALSSVNTASTNLTNAIQSVTSAKNSLTGYEIAANKAKNNLENTKKKAAADIKIAEADLAQAQATYDALTATPRDVDLASLRADVSRYAANLASAQNEFSKTQLRAAADGVIATMNVSVGENVSALQEVVTLVSAEKTIEVDISESDVAKISMGDPVNITLDAFGDDTVLQGKVVSVDPGKTEVSGVVYYKTKIIFTDTHDLPIRSGMTANVDIITETKEGVVVAPQRAIITEGQRKFVRVLTNKERGEFDEREVETGLRGDNGMTEIVSGISAGEEIITFIKLDE